jgi:hypothetical protein
MTPLANDDMTAKYARERAAWLADHPGDEFPPFAVWLYFELGGR